MQFARYLPAFLFILVFPPSPFCVALLATPQQSAETPTFTDELLELRSELQAATDLDDTSKAQVESELAAAEKDLAGR